MKIKWLSRDLIIGSYLTLCTSQKEFDAILKHINHPIGEEFISDGERGKHHAYIKKSTKQQMSIVCIDPDNLNGDDEVAGILVHESVHVWQAFCDWINEIEPSYEFEAYSIQNIFLELWLEYQRRKINGKKRSKSRTTSQKKSR